MVLHKGMQCTAGIVTFELCKGFGFSLCVSSSLEQGPKHGGLKEMG